jgi:hypothetical protein
MLKGALTALAALALSGTALGSGEPWFKLKPGYTPASAIAKVERTANRTTGFSGTDCWLSDGNRRIGWRHGNCVGNYNYAGTTYRFRVTYTPVSCTRERVVIVIPGVKRQVETVKPPRDSGFKIVC